MRVFAFVVIWLNCISFIALIFQLLKLRRDQKFEKDRSRDAYALGMDQGEQLGMKRGYRLALVHFARTKTGKPPTREEIPL
jgi:hypothetical protein